MRWLLQQESYILSWKLMFLRKGEGYKCLSERLEAPIQFLKLRDVHRDEEKQPELITES